MLKYFKLAPDFIDILEKEKRTCF